ncbi:MAG TPA: alpha/beta hydrolase, partial [Alphaproteobacteria bacterium]|nr:alpha/beta hydrolase [Alphaproteobacteria bacterium]
MSAKITSRDGTEIAYDSVGTGPALIVVAGATQFRAFDSSLAVLAGLL